MHILIIHQAFAALGEPGGTRHHELALYLARKGHRVTIIASPVSYITGTASAVEGEAHPGVTIRRAWVYTAHHRSFIHRTIAFFSFMVSSFFIGLGVRKVDLVWGTSPPIFQGWAAWMLARLKRVPLLFEVRDLWPKFAIAVGVLTNPRVIRMSLWLERFLYSHADQLVVNSPAYVEHVQGIAPGKPVHLVPNGADPAMFDPADRGEAFRTGHALADKFVVLYAGAHGMSNDLGVVLEAAGRLKDRPEVQIVLLGDGKEKPGLQTRAGELNLDNVTFLPPVSKRGMAAALAGADACIAILKPIEAYKITYPNKVFDYMAAGRPVALAIDGVIREVIEAAGCGLFAQPGDPAALAEAIRELAGSPEHSRLMGLSGRRYVEEYFNRAGLAEKLLGILEEMTGTAGTKDGEAHSI
ncbi:MAG: glycosyltransferase family 4 protein [Anaerolineales bacterium]|nr:glycosyltransferase family 4 protein [Anaerolineales bacterium]